MKRFESGDRIKNYEAATVEQLITERDRCVKMAESMKVDRSQFWRKKVEHINSLLKERNNDHMS